MTDLPTELAAEIVRVDEMIEQSRYRGILFCAVCTINLIDAAHDALASGDPAAMHMELTADTEPRIATDDGDTRTRLDAVALWVKGPLAGSTAPTMKWMTQMTIDHDQMKADVAAGTPVYAPGHVWELWDAYVWDGPEYLVDEVAYLAATARADRAEAELADLRASLPDAVTRHD